MVARLRLEDGIKDCRVGRRLEIAFAVNPLPRRHRHLGDEFRIEHSGVEVFRKSDSAVYFEERCFEFDRVLLRITRRCFHTQRRGKVGHHRAGNRRIETDNPGHERANGQTMFHVELNFDRAGKNMCETEIAGPASPIGTKDAA